MPWADDVRAKSTEGGPVKVSLSFHGKPNAAQVVFDKPRKGQPFMVPTDVLKKLGNGAVGVGYGTLCNAVGCHPMHGKLGEIPAAVVAGLGDGDPVTGRGVLQKFITRVRQRSEAHGDKASKAEAHYRAGDEQRCEICTMFRAPASCTAVTGSIDPEALCDYFEPRQDAA
jgi:hypothetical protein